VVVSAALSVDEDVVRAIVEQVWESLLQAEAVPWFGTDPADRPSVAAEVTLAGDWNGAVRMSCDVATAERLAGTMLGTPDEPLPEEDVHDAVGEIVNVIGGNVKGSLEGTTSLGLPTVDVGTLVPPAAPVSRCVLDWYGAPVTVEVLAARPA
jgi:chemotaxis protein CheX